LLYFNFNQNNPALKFEVPINADIVAEKYEVQWKLYFRDTFRLRLIYLVISLVLILLSICALLFNKEDIAFILALIGLVYLGFLIRNYFSIREALSISRRSLWESIRRREQNHDISIWEFTDSEFAYKNMDMETRIKWYVFKGYLQTEKYLFLFLSDSINDTYCVARSEVGYQGFDAIIELVRQKMTVSYKYAVAAARIGKIKINKTTPGFLEQLYRKNVRNKSIIYGSITAGVIGIFFLMNYMAGKIVGAMQNQYVSMSSSKVSEYLTLFDSATTENTFASKTYRGEGYPVCLYDCYSKYDVVITKVKCDSGISLRDIVHEETGNWKGVSDSYYEISGGRKKIWYREKPASPISSIYILFSKNMPDALMKNENVSYYSIKGNDFSIRYGKDSSYHIYTETDHMLFERKSPSPKELMFLKKGDNIYILILSPSEETNMILKKGQLQTMLKKVE